MKTIDRHITPFVVAFWLTCAALPALAQQFTERTFPSPAEASNSLFQAVQGGNEQAIARILGGAAELISSSDPGQDKVDRELFVQKYREMHRLHREADGSVNLYIGAENWPFPVPLVNQNGAWRFDPVAGKMEVLFRRIGENELTAIANCRQFAASTATGGAADGDRVLNGYHFRLLSGKPVNLQTTPAIALIAYPAEYRSSGVMTFIVTQDGVVYEKDLGANTTELAGAMAAFHKDPTWRVADE